MEKRVHKGVQGAAGNAQHWCTFCRTYVYNNKVSMRKHEENLSHKNAVKKFIETKSKEAEEQAALKREFAQRTGVFLGTSKPSSSVTESSKSAPNSSYYGSGSLNLMVSKKLEPKKSIGRGNKPSPTSTMRSLSLPVSNAAPWKKVVISQTKKDDDVKNDLEARHDAFDV
jgi:hypothetical protein